MREGKREIHNGKHGGCGNYRPKPGKDTSIQAQEGHGGYWSVAVGALHLGDREAKIIGMWELTKYLRWAAGALVIALIFYLAAAYLVAPDYWRHYERQAGLAAKSMTTVNAWGIPGDAINIGLEGERDDILCSLLYSGWRPADPVTFKSSFKIAGSVLAHRAYLTAPISDLFWDGRKHDLAFEKPSGVSPSHRHHVRFWLALAKGASGAPVWLGAATFDRSVGLSHFTGQVTHHIAAKVPGSSPGYAGVAVAV